MSVSLLAGCGGSDAPASNADSATTADADEEGDYEEEGEDAGEGETASEKQWVYDSGFYVNDGSSDAVLCFFQSSDGDQIA